MNSNIDKRSLRYTESNRVTRAAILRYLQEYQDIHGRPPTITQIGAAVGLRSRTSLHRHLRRMEEQGMIQRNPERSIIILAP